MSQVQNMKELRLPVLQTPRSLKSLNKEASIDTPRPRGRHRHYSNSYGGSHINQIPTTQRIMQSPSDNHFLHSLHQQQELHKIRQQQQESQLHTQKLMVHLISHLADKPKPKKVEEDSGDDEDFNKLIFSKALHRQTDLLQDVAQKFQQGNHRREAQERSDLMDRIRRLEMRDQLHHHNLPQDASSSDNVVDSQNMSMSRVQQEMRQSARIEKQLILEQLRQEQGRLQIEQLGNHTDRISMSKSRNLSETPRRIENTTRIDNESPRSNQDCSPAKNMRRGRVAYPSTQFFHQPPLIHHSPYPYPQHLVGLPHPTMHPASAFGMPIYDPPNLPQFTANSPFEQSASQLAWLSPNKDGTHQFPSPEKQQLYSPYAPRIVYRQRNDTPDLVKNEEEKKKKEEKEKTKKKKKTKPRINVKEKTEHPKSLGKQKAKAKLSVLLWTVVYSLLLDAESKSKVEERKQKMQDSIEGKYRVHLIAAQRFLLQHCSKQLDDIYKEKHSMCVVSGDEKGFFGTKTISEREVDVRLTNHILPKVRSLLTAVTEAITKTELPQDLQIFLASISEDQCIPPNNFYFNMEIFRMNFTHLGTLKGMEELQSKMVVGFFVVVRVLVYQLLLEPWSETQGLAARVPKSETSRKSLKALGSVIYLVFEDFVKNSVNVQENNQLHLEQAAKIKPMVDGGLYYIDKAEDKSKRDELTDVAIGGTYTKSELAALFDNKPKEVQHLQEHLMQLLESIYKQTHQQYQNNRQAIVGVE